MKKVKFNLVTDKEDIKELSNMASEIWHEYFINIISKEQIDYMIDMFLSEKSIQKEIKEGYEFYFENNGECNVGFMVVKPEEERLLISKLYVYSKYRGQGYGTPMFDEARKIAVAYDLDKMYLTVNKGNISSIEIYEHKGFTKIDSVKNDIGNGFFMDDYIFEYNISKRQMAHDYFLEGYNCSQAVVATFAKEMDIPKDNAVKMVSAFGGGIGRLREVCGAVSGIAFVLGNLYGYNDPKSINEKARLYENVQKLADNFKMINGSIICRECLGLEQMRDDPRPEKRTEDYYKKRSCQDFVGDAANILDEFIRSRN